MTFEWFPDWQGARWFLYSDQQQVFVQDTQQQDDVTVYRLAEHAQAATVDLHLELPETCPGGLELEGWSLACIG